MSTTGGGSSLVVVHRCEKCGHAARFSELNVDSTVSGVYICPACSHSGPLHPEILTKAELLDEDRQPSDQP